MFCRNLSADIWFTAAKWIKNDYQYQLTDISRFMHWNIFEFLITSQKSILWISRKWGIQVQTWLMTKTYLGCVYFGNKNDGKKNKRKFWNPSTLVSQCSHLQTATRALLLWKHTQTCAVLFSFGLSCLARAKVQLSSSASNQVIIKHTMLQKIVSCLPSLM